MQLTPLTPAAISEVLPFFAARRDRFCDWTAGVICLWQPYYRYRYTLTDGCFSLVGHYGEGDCFSYPTGGDVSAALDSLAAHSRAAGQPLRFSPVTPEEAATLAARWPQAIVTTHRDAWDYLYRYTDLSSFAGRRYSPQRNHLHRFTAACPDWQYRPMTPADAPAVEAFLRDFNARRAADGGLSAAEQAEEEALPRLLALLAPPQPEALPAPRILGGLLLVDGRLAAFSVGEILGDTLHVHVEKADTAYPGIYPMMVREFAAHSAAPGVEYINRQDDAGSEGLRHSKLAYHPCALLEKCTVTVPRDAL